MINQTRIKKLLYNNTKARERRFKDKATAHLLIQEFGLDIPLSKMERVVTKTLNSDRLWRKILKENKELRGKDYDVRGSKKMLEQKAQEKLGYESGYHENIKKLKTL